MTLGTLYGVGVGPGDPELVTLKAIKTLQSVAEVFTAASGSGLETRSVARAIIAPHLTPGVPVTELPFPMTRDPDRLASAWERNARRVLDVLETGRSVAFATLGDPMTYSTFGHLRRTVLTLRPDVPVSVVPGITSFAAAAATLGRPLTEGAEAVAVLAGPDRLEELAPLARNLVVLKAGRDFAAVREQLSRLGLEDRATLVLNLGLPGQRIIADLAEAPGELPYFSLLLLKTNASS